jgi:SAM-dependent methyltransferase
VARRRGTGFWSRTYHNRLEKVCAVVVPPGRTILELGCGGGDLLARLRPAFGVGVDLSLATLLDARRQHPELAFVLADAHELPLRGRFDVVVMDDLVNDLWDVQATVEGLRRLVGGGTRFLITAYSRLWELPLALARRLRLARPLLPQNWLTPQDIADLLGLADCEVVQQSHEVLLPLPIPLLAGFCNRFLVRIWPLGHLALANLIVARPRIDSAGREDPPVVSVIVPARNEAGNIEAILERTPEMGAGTELVFVEGHSSDGTWQAILSAVAAHPERRCKALQQTGVGKGDAVRLGFAEASGRILVILDADLTVQPEDLPRFVEVLIAGKADLVNGVRLVYPMAGRAMRFWNTLGNKFFGLAFSWVLGQPVRDTLCGTKALYREAYQRIAEGRDYFGTLDPFGDFDLLLGAARLAMKIVGVPVRYGARTYGETNIQRWRHGWLLLRMLALAARRIKLF